MNMRFIFFLTSLFIASLVCEAAKQPNIIVFLVDDMGLMDTSVPFMLDNKGKPKKHPLNEWYRTPSMERLAARGIRFTDFYAHTVCSPSRSSIMLGQNSARHHTTNFISGKGKNTGKNGAPGWNFDGLTSKHTTIAKLLTNEGYKTIMIGKGHFGAKNTEGAEPLNLGFQTNIGAYHMGQPGSYYGENNYRRGNNGSFQVPHMEKYHGTKTFLTEALTLEAKDQIDKAIGEDKPFYLYMSHYAVHSPFSTDPRFIDHYPETEKGKNASAFATLIEGMDKSLGDIMDHLEAKGIAENTLILFLGDNGSDAPIKGPHAGQHSSAPLRGKKGSKWEGGVRVPFIAAWATPNPKNKLQQKLPIAKGAIQTQIAACFDIFPTITNMLSIKTPAQHIVDGQNLDVLFTAKEDRNRENVFLSHFPHPRTDKHFTTYRVGDWKLIYHYFPKQAGIDKGNCLLYNLKEDISESKDLAQQMPDKVKEMVIAMKKDLESKGAQYSVDDNKHELKPIVP